MWLRRAVVLLVAATLILASVLMAGRVLPLQAAWLAPDDLITVTSTDDVRADDGLCTLREAIIAANTNTPSGGTAGEYPAPATCAAQAVAWAAHGGQS
jgi:CSLREA domain-containing protein